VFNSDVVLTDAILEDAIMPDGTRFNEEPVTTIR
jgi:hypothetical protein